MIASENQEETLESKINKWGEAFIENYNIPGMQLSVSSKNNTLFSKGFGYSDIENKKKVNPKTRFRIASVTKPMTAAAIIKLASEDKLDLDADVPKYVPAFPKKKHTLTTRQLAGLVIIMKLVLMKSLETHISRMQPKPLTYLKMIH